MAERRLAVYGATGYTGRLVVDELRRRGVDAVVCGRDREKVAAVAGSDLEPRVASLDDRAALRAALEGCDAVISCAGPFTRLGPAVVEAALDAGAHYVDTTGEQPFIRDVFERFGERADAAAVALVPAGGFDCVPGDLLASLVARGREPLDELTVAYAIAGFGASRGTMRSVLEMLRGGELEYAGGRWRPAGRPPIGERFAFDEPLGPRPVVRYPGGEVITVPRHVRTREVRVRIAASTFAPLAAAGPVVPAVAGVLQPLLRTPLARMLERGIDRMPEGPAEDERQATRFRIEAVARGEDGAVGRGWIEGRDVYGLTAATAAAVAVELAGSDRRGALAPAQAVEPEPFLSALAGRGVRFGAARAPIAAAA